MHIIFSFWALEIIERILRHQKLMQLGLDLFSEQIFNIWSQSDFRERSFDSYGEQEDVFRPGYFFHPQCDPVFLLNFI